MHRSEGQRRHELISEISIHFAIVRDVWIEIELLGRLSMMMTPTLRTDCIMHTSETKTVQRILTFVNQSACILNFTSERKTL